MYNGIAHTTCSMHTHAKKTKSTKDVWGVSRFMHIQHVEDLRVLNAQCSVLVMETPGPNYA